MEDNEVITTHPVGEQENRGSPTIVDAYGGRIRVLWDDDAEVTAYGHLPFFSEFLRETEFFENWISTSPLKYTSNNSHAVRDVLGTIMLSLLSGQKRYSHITSLRADCVAPKLFGMSKVVSEDSARRGIAKIDSGAGEKWLRSSLRESYEELLNYSWILDIDTTIKPIYGHQEGAEIGYNPQKPGRPSHAYHTYIMANTRLILDADVAAGKEHTSLSAQHVRNDAMVARRIKLARFPVLKSLDNFQWSWPKKCNAIQIKNLFRLTFLENASNVIFLGGVGLGKTHLSIALGYAACLKGHSVLFATAIDTVNALIAAQAQGRLRQELSRYLKPSLLILDELGYLPVDKAGADLLFQIISQRYERGSIIITSNRPYKKWPEIFNNDATMTSAALDRLLHHAQTIQIEGPSFRMKDQIA